MDTGLTAHDRRPDNAPDGQAARAGASARPGAALPLGVPGAGERQAAVQANRAQPESGQTTAGQPGVQPDDATPQSKPDAENEPRLGLALDAITSGRMRVLDRFAKLPGPVRYVGYGIGGLVVAWCVVLALVYLRLLFGPVSIDGFAPRIAAAVEARLPPGFQLDVSGADIERVGAGFGVRLTDARVRDAQGAPMFSAPAVTVGFSLLSFASGDIAPRSLILSAPNISLIGGGEATGTLNAADIVAIAFVVLNPDGGIEELDVTEATVSAAGEGVHLEGVHARLFAEHSGSGPSSIALEARGGLTPQSEWAANGRLVRRDDGGISGELAFADLVPDALFPATTAGPRRIAAETPVSGQVSFATLLDGTLADARFDILIGAGRIQAGDDVSFKLDEARISGSWDAARRVMKIAPSRFLAGRSRAVLGGEIAFPDNRSMSYGTVPIGLGFTDVHIATREDAEPVVIDAVVFDAVYEIAARQVRVGRFDFLAGDASISMLGYLRQAPGSPGIALRGEAARMSMDVFKSLWPEGVAPATRDWLMRQVHGGDIVNATVNVSIEPGELAAVGGLANLSRNAVSVTFRIEDADFGYFYDLPAIRSATLDGRWTPSSFELEFVGDKARIDLPASGPVFVTGGSYMLRDTRVNPVQAELEILTRGPLPSHLLLLDHDPLNVPTSRGMDIAQTAGDVAMRMTMDMPIREGLTIADTGLIVDATITGLRFPASPEQVIEKGDVTLTIRNGLLRVSGEGQIDGVKADLSVSEPIYGNAGESERQVSLILDAKSRKALGLDFGDFLQGEFPVVMNELDEGRRRVEADLKNARLYQPAVGLDKPPGSPATFAAILSPDAETGGTRLSDIRLSGRELFVSGSGLVRANGQIAALDLDTFRLQGDDSARMSVRTDKGGNFNVEIEAVRFDMRRVLDNAKTGGLAEGGARSGDTRRYKVAAVIGSARGYNGEILQSVDIDLDMKGDDIRYIKMTGAFSDNSTMRFEIARPAARPDPVMSVSGNNAGRLLRWLDLYSRINGGQIGMRATLGKNSGDARGRFQIVNFAIDRDPSLSTLIDRTGSLRGDPSWQEASRNAPNTANMGFDEFYVDFARARGIFDFRHGVLRGPAVGATFDGQVDFTGRRVAANGTYVPLYAINNFFGRVPLLGTILGGRSNEGLIGVNFSVAGDLARPTLTVNPVSAVTPGIFRLLLDAPSRSMQSGGQSPQPGNNGVSPDRFDPLAQQPGR